MLEFACIALHPPIILPDVGSSTDRKKVKKTIEAMETLGKKFAQVKPDLAIISSPHPDWGFKVPLYFLTKKLRSIETKTFLTDFQSPKVHFEQGKKIITGLPQAKSVAWIASGDMSHRLSKDGPYGLHFSGKKYDDEFIKLLKKKDVQGILNLPERLAEEAGECGWRSFCTLFGALEGASAKWQPEILSYEAPFGVGYLVANITIK